MYTPGSSPQREANHRFSPLYGYTPNYNSRWEASSQAPPANGVPSSPKTSKIKIYNPARWDPVDHDAQVREVHAGFISRTETNIRELQQYVTVSERARIHMYELLKGDMDLPWILLQNPADTQDEESFDEVVSQTETLGRLCSWIRMVKPHLDLNTMPIIDVFPLVSNSKLEFLPPDDQETVTRIVFRITMDLIWTYRPPMIISMQCYSKGGTYKFVKLRGDFSHHVAQAISSSQKMADGPISLYPRTLRESDVYGRVLGQSERDNYINSEFSFNVIMSQHPVSLFRDGYTHQDFYRRDRTIDILRYGYSRCAGDSRSVDIQRDGSLHSCYLRILRKQKQRSEPHSGRLPPLDDEDIRASCRYGLRITDNRQRQPSFAEPMTPPTNTINTPLTPSPTPHGLQVDKRMRRSSVTASALAEAQYRSPSAQPHRTIVGAENKLVSPRRPTSSEERPSVTTEVTTPAAGQRNSQTRISGRSASGDDLEAVTRMLDNTRLDTDRIKPEPEQQQQQHQQQRRQRHQQPPERRQQQSSERQQQSPVLAPPRLSQKVDSTLATSASTVKVRSREVPVKTATAISSPNERRDAAASPHARESARRESKLSRDPDPALDGGAGASATRPATRIQPRHNRAASGAEKDARLSADGSVGKPSMTSTARFDRQPPEKGKSRVLVKHDLDFLERPSAQDARTAAIEETNRGVVRPARVEYLPDRRFAGGDEHPQYLVSDIDASHSRLLWKRKSRLSRWRFWDLDKLRYEPPM